MTESASHATFCSSRLAVNVVDLKVSIVFCARARPKKRTKTYKKKFPSITYVWTYSFWRSLSIWLLPLITWRVLVNIARELRLTWSRPPRGLGRTRLGTRPIPLKATRVVLWSSSLVASRVVVLRGTSIVGLPPCIVIVTWRKRSAGVGSWMSRVTMPRIIRGRTCEGPKGRHEISWRLGTKNISSLKTERKRKRVNKQNQGNAL